MVRPWLSRRPATPDRGRKRRQGSGRCSSSTSTASRWRRCAPWRKSCCARACGRTTDRRDSSAGTEPLQLPAPLADRVALAAAQRLLSALAPTQSRGPGCGRLLAPDGRYEHASMTALRRPRRLPPRPAVRLPEPPPARHRRSPSRLRRALPPVVGPARPQPARHPRRAPRHPRRRPRPRHRRRHRRTRRAHPAHDQRAARAGRDRPQRHSKRLMLKPNRDVAGPRGAPGHPGGTRIGAGRAAGHLRHRRARPPQQAGDVA